MIYKIPYFPFHNTNDDNRQQFQNAANQRHRKRQKMTKVNFIYKQKKHQQQKYRIKILIRKKKSTNRTNQKKYSFFKKTFSHINYIL